MTHEDAIAAILAREQEKGVVTEAELRQQLADVTNERDGLRVSLAEQVIVANTMGKQAATFHNMSDKHRRALKASEARNAELERVLGGMLFAFDDGVGQDWSAPLLDYARKQCKAVEYIDYPNADIAADAAAGLHDIDFPGPDEDQDDAPATDEQGGGVMKPLSKVEYAKLMTAARDLGNRDKSAGLAECLPMQCADLKLLIGGLNDSLRSKCITEYVTAFNGYRLNVRTLPGMFSDNKEY